MNHSLVLIAAILMTAGVRAQTIPDTEFNPPVAKPAYPKDGGPVVMIDEAHHNWHTASNRFLPFAELLRRDGYVVRASQSQFSKGTLKSGHILVIANALNKRNDNYWVPPYPSPFTDEEIKTVHNWIQDGGALLLIADHLPWPAAVDKLASAFGVHYSPGHALNEKTFADPMIFRRSDGTLAEHRITTGRAANERVDSVATFTGSAFRVDKGAEGLLIFGPGMVSFTPTNFWMFDTNSPRSSVTGWYQGAVLRVGKGRMAVFGEAGMFSAQVDGPKRVPFGMNTPEAKQNPQFILNVLHWLSGLLEE
ncbi:MAG TPA: DUF4350 domain-containing protein [Candidatus Sulfotelmatobacter sp.]|nr:DUF4350 domain-containing protein [Candidatus Sulfotelmatobacter sp.]